MGDLRDAARFELSPELRARVDAIKARRDGGAHGPMPRRSVYDAPVLGGRKLEILELVAGGLNNREIADRLFLSEETVKTHMRQTFVRLDARNRAHAVALAYQQGLFAPAGPGSPV